jgi:translocator protein
VETSGGSDMLALAGFAAACFAAAMSGGIFRPGEWYESIAKPSWRPPNWLFGPAWLVLFCLIAVAAWRVWRIAGFDGASLAMAIFFVQLVLNAAWSAFFFGLRRPDWAFYNLVALWLSIAAMIAAYAPIDQTAAWMMVPYLAWVTFAGVLNRTIWRMNPALTGNG